MVTLKGSLIAGKNRQKKRKKGRRKGMGICIND